MKRFLRMTQEAAFGVYSTADTSIYIRLSGSNAFQPMTDPEWWEVMDGSGLGVPALRGSATTALTATLTTEVTYSQAPILLAWALQRIGPGQTTPWTTTEIPNDLASVTIDLAWSEFDTSGLKRKRFLGCKAGSVRLSCSRANPKLMATIGVIGGTPQGNNFDSSTDPTAAAFPEPALTVYPSDVALFEHLKGNVTIASGSRTNFETWDFNSAHTLNAYFDESRFANAIRLGGRRITASSRFRLKSAIDDRTTYENATVQQAQLEWTYTTHSITLNMNTQNYISPFKEDLPIDREVYYDYGLVNLLDPTNTGELAITIT